MYRVVLNRSECIGCGNCEEECPDMFEVQGDGYSHIKVSSSTSDKEEVELSELSCVVEAANACPVECIIVYEDEKLLAP
ncbi:MAG: ferredoxin [Methermicoccaceae archaeon]